MPTITFEANEHGQLRVELRGLAASYAGAEIVLAGGPAYSDAPLSTWASVAGVAPGDGEVAGYDLPLPQLEPGRFALEVYAATPGERRADIMPAPGETIVLKVGDRRHDNGDTTPPAQVTVQQGTSTVREAEGREGSDVRLYVADPSGTRLDGEATHTLAATAVRVVERKIDLPTDDLGRLPSVPTDSDGQIPLRARLDAIKGAAEGAATPDQVEALLEALAAEHAALKAKHETLQGEHAQLIEQLGQVLDAVGQIPTEQAGGGWSGKTEWAVKGGEDIVLPASGEVIEWDVPIPHFFGIRAAAAAIEVELTVEMAGGQARVGTRLRARDVNRMRFFEGVHEDDQDIRIDARGGGYSGRAGAVYKAWAIAPERQTFLPNTTTQAGRVNQGDQPAIITDTRTRIIYQPLPPR